MSEPIVVRAEDDSILAHLMRYVSDKKTHLVQLMGNSLLQNEDRDAIVAAASLHQLDEFVEVIQEAIEETNRNYGDEPHTEPTRITN